MSWIRFKDPDFSVTGKTKLWTVETADGATLLGQIRWFSKWRQYAFHPMTGTVYEQDCLREIATFCEQATIEHKAK